MGETRDFEWDERPHAPGPSRPSVQLPFEQRGTTGIIARAFGFPTGGSLFGRIHVDRDAVTIKGAFWRTRRFPRGSTHISAAKGILASGVRLRSGDVLNDVVFFPYDDGASLRTALKLAGFRSM